MNDLYGKYNCVSLGWGSPDFQPPKFLRDALEQAMEIPANNNYGRPNGHPELIKAVAEVYGPKMGRKIDPMTEIMVTQGANGALNTIMQTLLHNGDEVVVFSPCFPVYVSQIELAGGYITEVPLEFHGEQ